MLNSVRVDVTKEAWKDVDLVLPDDTRSVLVLDPSRRLVTVAYLDRKDDELDWRYVVNDELLLHDSFFPQWWAELSIQFPPVKVRT